MYIKYCNKAELKNYIRFCKDIYSDDENFKDSLTGILEMVLYNKGEFCKTAEITPLIIVEGDKILAACTFIAAKKLSDTLQIAFFEARKNCQEAVDLIIDAAKEKCKAAGLKKITIGLNGHVNYGLGLLDSDFGKAACFGSSYNPPYYTDYFSRYGGKEYILTSYLTDMDRYNLEGSQRILDRISRNFTFRIADFRHLKREVQIYTDLNNRCFEGHPFYFERTFEEDYELLSQFKPFINGENLLLAERKGKPVGFMLWYPDFNQLIPTGGRIGLGTYIKNKLAGWKIDRFKIVEIGIVPEYQNSGVVLGLFNKCMELTKHRYKWCEAGWILDTNNRSKGFGVRWADKEYKRYKAYEIEV
jgi:ribosomal protein S18 acetylase RimI-like enzyme